LKHLHGPEEGQVYVLLREIIHEKEMKRREIYESKEVNNKCFVFIL